MPHNTKAHWEHIHKMYYHSILRPRLEDEWAPNTDIYGDDAGLTVKLEVAGVRKEDIHISFDKSLLTVSGIRSDPALCAGEKPDRQYTQAEIDHGYFRRTIKIDLPVDSRKATSQLVNGMLLIRFPWLKTEKKTIPVETDNRT